MNYLIQLVTAFLGSLGFAAIFNIKKDKLLPAACGGLLSWSVYLLVDLTVNNDAVSTFAASMAFTVYAEIMARVKKTPATLFLVPATIPLIPGASLYTTMRYAMQGETDACIRQAEYTLLLAIAIACGILCVMTVWRIIQTLTKSEIMRRR